MATIMTKEGFYKFGIMMANDSKLLFDDNRLHNSVYLGAFVLEAYIKIILIIKNSNYMGHINDRNNNFLNKLETIKSIHPEFFENSILKEEHSNYPRNILSEEYDINFRYEVDRWTDATFCQDVQNEVSYIQRELSELRIQE
jgi:hypothetical protein